jgi:Brp/Blh family beta-carotene 15,15'-monooxygenase
MWVILLTFSFGIFSLLFKIPYSVELGVFILLMIVLGIPHGATDHIVFFSKKNTTSKKQSWTYFLKIYLGIMLAYSLAWYILPLVCFIAFLLFSAYHFGQSQLYYFEIKKTKSKWLKLVLPILYLSWGNVLLLSILGFNKGETLSILSETPFFELMQFVLIHFSYFLGVNLALLSLILTGLILQSKISFLKVLQEVGLLALLLFLCWSTSLLWSFAIYFALWHSLQTIEQEIKVFDIHFEKHFDKKYSWKNYIKDALPFSLISFLGIGMILIGLSFFEFNTSNLLFVFFVLISILTAPHAWLIENIYE